MGRAFADRSPFTWIEPDEEDRARLLPALFAALLRFYPVERGVDVAVEDGAIVGCAVWAPPGRWKVPWWLQVGAFPGMVAAIGLRGLLRLGERGPKVEAALRAAHPREPHWYLAALGVEPSAHGRGLGGALLRAGLARCDQEGKPAYLECLEELVPYYERHGFLATGRIELPEEALPQVSMWRPASNPTDPSPRR